MRLGVFGGTFDPLHIGHLVLAECAREELSLEKVLFMPAGQPWRKIDRLVTPAGHRVAMAKLGVQDNPAFVVSTIEVDTPGPSYTAATLEQVLAKNVGADLFVLLGVDAFRDLPNWKNPARIAQFAVIAVTGRPGYHESGEDIANLEALSFGERVRWFRMPEIGVSATALRESVRLGKSIRYLVPAAVEAYIEEHGLYRA